MKQPSTYQPSLGMVRSHRAYVLQGSSQEKKRGGGGGGGGLGVVLRSKHICAFYDHIKIFLPQKEGHPLFPALARSQCMCSAMKCCTHYLHVICSHCGT